jgi:nitrite reductase (NADH) large subunit
VVVVGNGMAGMRTVEELVARVPDRCDITVIGDEPHPSYNRILLSSVLADERPLAEIGIQPFSWYEKHGIHSIAATTPLRLTRLRGEWRSPMEPLFLTTNCFWRPDRSRWHPQFRALTFANVRAFRDIADVEARNHRRAAASLEAAWGLKQRGMSVALVHLIPTLMERQLGECIEHNGQVFGLTRAGNGTIKIETKTARVIVLA